MIFQPLICMNWKGNVKKKHAQTNQRNDQKKNTPFRENKKRKMLKTVIFEKQKLL